MSNHSMSDNSEDSSDETLVVSTMEETLDDMISREYSSRLEDDGSEMDSEPTIQTTESEEPRRKPTNIQKAAKDQPLNNSLLDKLVMEYLVNQGIILENTLQQEHDSELVKKRKILFEIRACVIQGKILQALQLATQCDPKILNNRDLMFKLHLQNFIEMVRYAKQDDKKLECLEYCKNVLVPLASDSYPNAYNEFKSVLPLLIFSEKDTQFAQFWSLSRREKLACELHTQLLISLRIEEPMLAMLIRYLIPIHNMYHIMKGLQTSYPNIGRKMKMMTDRVEKLIFPDRDPLPREVEIPVPNIRVKESNVQMLSAMLSISQQTAENALKQSGDNLEKALKSELCRIRLNHELLIPMTLQYCSGRGLLNNVKVNLAVNVSTEQSDKLLMLRKLREAVSAGDIPTVISIVKEIDPKYFEKYPDLYFNLKQREFVNMINQGKFFDALNIASKDLAPLTQEHPEWLDKFKNTILLLGFNNRENMKFEIEDQITKQDIAGPLYSGLAQKIGITDSPFMVMLKYMLCAHTLWFKYQQSTDRFESTFQIDQLKKADANVEKDKKDEDHMFDEQAVKSLMEVLQIQRSEAIHLLEQNDGSLDAVFASVFG